MRWVVLGVLMCAVAPLQFAGAYDRPGPFPHQSRSPVLGRKGMVATSHPLASQVGLDVLKNGGTAADAAIAANAMLGVVEPMSCGIGGDLFVLYWDAKTKTLTGLNASGRSPYSLTREIFKEKMLTQIPDTGPLSWSVPGCVDGWEMLRAKFGKKTLADLLGPAIETAEEGFPVSEVIAGHWLDAEKSLSEWPDSKSTYLPEGKAPKTGEIFRNPHLAATYRQLAAGGRDAFYKGEIAQKLVAFSEANKGHLTLKDLESHTGEWIPPVSTNYRGYDIWELPPNGQGIAVLQMLNILEAYDVSKMGPDTPEYLHLLVEAKKLAYADRARYYADPTFSKVPTKELISKEYAARQRKRIDPNKAALDVPPGDPLKMGDTVYLCAVDAEGNCCSLIQSIYYGFGSQVVPGDLGFALQNRGCLFALDEMHPNKLEPHKRPFHTIIPAMVTKDGLPWFVFGVMGGDMQPQGHVQVLVNLIDFKMNVQAAGDAGRIQHRGSSSPTGDPAAPNGGTVYVETAIPEATRKALGERGHTVIVSPGGYGGYQGILIDRERGVLHGGTEARKDGDAAGY